MISRWKELRSLGILGMNQRNVYFIQHYNQRKHFPLADNKLITKRLAKQAGISIPSLYHTVTHEHEINVLEKVLAQFEDFVVKPAHGSGGDGILVIIGRRKLMYEKSNGQLIEQETLNHHVSNILSGMYSLGGHSDVAMFEYRVKFDRIFENVSYQGVPDIRMLVFQGYPVMGMVRLPTRMSHGKANLHQGAIGVGIELKSGRTTTGVLHNKIIDVHPDTNHDIAALQIPQWDNLLNIAVNCFDLSKLGYLGVDIVLDGEKGPLMLELNARPGLNIQIANQAGLLPRLKAIEALSDVSHNVAEKVAFCKERF